MTKALRSFLLFLMMIVPLVLMGCGEEPGPAEKAGKKIDRAMHKAADKAKELTR